MAGETGEGGESHSQPEKQPGQAAAAFMAEAEVEELPKAIVRRLVKEKLAQVAAGGAEVIVNKDAMSAFAESARIFIHYLSATANDMCKESKRQTINADDVLKALDEMEFPEFVEPLNTSLQEFRNKNAARRSETTQKKAEKRRKIDKESLPQEQNDAADNGKTDED
uniref:Transcription factor CBF/NF-Y/archaeal histone domain-containing protein n=1 Tax=Oryza meridionalis TaxID=40149 RepID=A0A0E0C6T3_9ORYZ